MGRELFSKPVPNTHHACLDNVQDLRVKTLMYYTQSGPSRLSELPGQFYERDIDRKQL